jgi:hypothetical protein
LTASNTYTGGTTISAGTLSIGAGGSIQGNVTNAASLVFDPTGSLVVLFSGNITNTSSNSIISVVSGTLQAGNGSVSNTIFGYTAPAADPGLAGEIGGTALTLTNGANLFNNIASLIAGGTGGTGGRFNPVVGDGGAGGVGVSFGTGGVLMNSGSISGGFGGTGGQGFNSGVLPLGYIGGTGGTGGTGVAFGTSGVLTNSGNISGGNGGLGGQSGTFYDGYGNQGYDGGSGGAGGDGVAFGTSGVLTNSGNISGGNGGGGGFGGAPPAYAYGTGGAGGAGGNGVAFGTSGVLKNSGNISGGSGAAGAGGVNGIEAGSSGGSGGAGGA